MMMWPPTEEAEAYRKTAQAVKSDTAVALQPGRNYRIDFTGNQRLLYRTGKLAANVIVGCRHGIS
jgi:hypothetical protein